MLGRTGLKPSRVQFMAALAKPNVSVCRDTRAPSNCASLERKLAGQNFVNARAEAVRRAKWGNGRAGRIRLGHQSGPRTADDRDRRRRCPKDFQLHFQRSLRQAAGSVAIFRHRKPVSRPTPTTCFSYLYLNIFLILPTIFRVHRGDTGTGIFKIFRNSNMLSFPLFRVLGNYSFTRV